MVQQGAPDPMALDPQAPDGQLLTRIAARDPEALSALYDRYRGVVKALALRVLRDRSEAEEALADVFLQAWSQAAAFDAARGSVAAWLMTLCRSRAIDRLRAQKRREAAHTTLARDASDSSASGASSDLRPDERAEISLKRRRISEALATLSAGQRRAIELAYYEGLSHSEIASRLGEPLGTVKTRIRQGMMALRENLAARFEA